MLPRRVEERAAELQITKIKDVAVLLFISIHLIVN